MHRCNIVPLILLVLSIVNFALAAPALIPGKCQACDDVIHVPKGVITALGKRADESNWIMRLLESFDRWLPGGAESGSERSDSEDHDHESVDADHDRESVDVDHDAPGVSSHESSIESGHSSDDAPGGSSQEPLIESGQSSHDAPGVSSQEPLIESEQSSHDALGASSQEPPIESGQSSHDAPGVSSQEPSIESGQSSMLPPDSGRFPIGMHSPGSDSDSDRWSTIANAPSAESLFENLQSANAVLKGKDKIERRITGTARSAANAAQSAVRLTLWGKCIRLFPLLSTNILTP